MNLNRINRDELASHTAEIMATQEDRITSLMQERRLLAGMLAAVVALQLIF